MPASTLSKQDRLTVEVNQQLAVADKMKMELWHRALQRATPEVRALLQAYDAVLLGTTLFRQFVVSMPPRTRLAHLRAANVRAARLVEGRVE